MSAQVLTPDLWRLRTCFFALVAMQLVALLAAMALLVGAFALHLAWALPAFALTVAAAVAAQVAFIIAFRRDSKKAA